MISTCLPARVGTFRYLLIITYRQARLVIDVRRGKVWGFFPHDSSVFSLKLFSLPYLIIPYIMYTGIHYVRYARMCVVYPLSKPSETPVQIDQRH